MVLEDPSCTDSIINDWQSLLPATLKQWGVEQKDLQSFFEDFRNNLLRNHEVSDICCIICNQTCLIAWAMCAGRMGKTTCHVPRVAGNPQELQIPLVCCHVASQAQDPKAHRCVAGHAMVRRHSKAVQQNAASQ